MCVFHSASLASKVLLAWLSYAPPPDIPGFGNVLEESGQAPSVIHLGDEAKIYIRSPKLAACIDRESALKHFVYTSAAFGVDMAKIRIGSPSLTPRMMDLCEHPHGEYEVREKDIIPYFEDLYRVEIIRSSRRSGSGQEVQITRLDDVLADARPMKGNKCFSLAERLEGSGMFLNPWSPESRRARDIWFPAVAKWTPLTAAEIGYGRMAVQSIQADKDGTLTARVEIFYPREYSWGKPVLVDKDGKPVTRRREVRTIRAGDKLVSQYYYGMPNNAPYPAQSYTVHRIVPPQDTAHGRIVGWVEVVGMPELIMPKE